MRKLLLSAFLFLLAVTITQAQQAVKGKITDENGAPIPGATISVKGSTIGTYSDNEGNFSFTIPPNKKVLLISAVGYGEKQIAISKETVFSISLGHSSKSMDEVVVVAYGSQKKESITGAITSVTAAAFEKRPLTNAVSALEGSAAGIQVNNTVGQPGSSPTIRIRGFSSVNYSNDPLYVIDGVPFGGSVADINPNDIESISVLKDAASSALYGSRASNGVIIMTTKKGLKNNTTSLNFTMNQGFYDKGINEYEKMGPNDYMQTMWTGYRNSLRTSNPATYSTDALAGAKATSSLISDYLKLNIYNKADNALFDADGKLVADAQINPLYGEDLDWNKGFERVGHRQDYNLTGRTGSEKNSLYFSMGYLNEKGYTNYSDFKRFSGRINADLTATKFLKYGFNLAGTHQVSNNTPAGSGSATSFTNPIFYARTIAPIYPVHLHQAGTGEYVLDALGNRQYDDGSLSRKQYAGRHAIWENELNKDQFFRNTLMGQAWATVTFLKHFAFNIVGDINSRTDDEQVYNNAIIGDGAGNNGRANRNNNRYLNYTARQTLSWNQTFNSLHNVEVMAGHENFNYEYNSLSGYKTNEIIPGGVQLVNFTSITSLSDYRDVYRTEGYFTRGRYSYADKYFLDASFRRDASTKFFNNPWGNFFSVGGSWTITKEKFFDQFSKQVNFLKLRASYGEVGNDGGTNTLSYYAGKDLYELNQNGNLGAVYRIQIGNQGLVWEKSASAGVALEGRIFNRGNFTIEYFDKQSKNLIFNYNLPLTAGPTSTTAAESVIIQNIGSVSNRGWEFTFDVDVVRTKDFTFNFGANATWLKNVVKQLPEANKKNGIINGTKKIAEGHSIYDYWLPQYAGVDQMNGNALYKPDTVTYNASNPIPATYKVTINGTNYTTNTTYAERNWSGSALPDVFGSFSTNFRYKSFTLGGLFTYAIGGKVYDNSYISLLTMSGAINALHKDLLNAWNGVPKDMTATSENRVDPKGIPVVDFTRSQFTNASSNRFLTNASYLVVKNINLSYKLPAELINKAFLKNVSVGVSAENLYTATKRVGMNPQQSFNGVTDNTFVTPRVVSFLLNVGL
jgi:TonB-linked SusC/RagA family outer membrane protein